MPAFLLKLLPFLAKLGFVGKLFAPIAAFIPGGQIGALLLSVASFVGTVIGWLWEAVVVACSRPQVFVLCFAFFAGGVYVSADWYREKVAEAHEQVQERDRTISTMLSDAEKLNAKDAKKHKAAIKAKAEAEGVERAKIAAEKPTASAAGATPGVLPAKRKAASCKNTASKSPLFGDWSIFGGTLPCKPS